MKQLTVKDLEIFINRLKKKYPQNYKDIPIYLGDDDELNSIHYGWWVEELSEDDYADVDIIAMINSRFGNVFKKIGVLIS